MPSSYSDEICELAGKFIFDIDDEFDLLVVSGDIATIGSKPSIDASYAYVATPYVNQYLGQNLQPTLGGNEQRIFLIPGNHDRYQNILGETGGVEFDSTFSKYWTTGNRVTSRALSKDGERLFFVSGDFSLRSNDEAFGQNRLGRGKAHRDVVAAMELESQKLEDQYGKGVVIWVVHFPPAHCDDSRMILIDRELLEGGAVRARARFILAGHFHKNEIMQTDHGTPIICAGSLCSCEEDGNNWIHQIDVEIEGSALKNVTKTDFAWSDEEQEFSQSSERQVHF